ncbi:kinase-like protein [Rozella allomycis CSF55]|uniref:Kinase-like protein n=1 Tax=Rozella allomycis (strain CSF55) TaxID=988480 RepID=A0A075B0Y1_ROZAC|nr:Protein kinase-like domain-containing protein [Rozella allomycis CSF55]RKP19899.1 kinase-like protein [Rozella allomycis CSF55]|eukprot:EPZ36053.1 Protein kinase-like domain-containing protein [Rozella allomycis CSF55]
MKIILLFTTWLGLIASNEISYDFSQIPKCHENDFKIIESFQGSRHYQVLQKAIHNPSGSLALIKYYSLSNSEASKRHVKEFQREIRVHHYVNSPMIQKLICYNEMITPGRMNILYFAVEYFEGVLLEKQLQAGRFTISETIELFYKILAGVKSLHASLLIHGNLTPSNILIKDGVIKLINFEYSSAENDWDINDHSVSSPYHIKDPIFTLATDLYSIGVIIYETHFLSTAPEAYSLERKAKEKYPSKRVENDDKPYFMNQRIFNALLPLIQVNLKKRILFLLPKNSDDLNKNLFNEIDCKAMSMNEVFSSNAVLDLFVSKYPYEQLKEYLGSVTEEHINLIATKRGKTLYLENRLLDLKQKEEKLNLKSREVESSSETLKEKMQAYETAKKNIFKQFYGLEEMKLDVVNEASRLASLVEERNTLDDFVDNLKIEIGRAKEDYSMFIMAFEKKMEDLEELKMIVEKAVEKTHQKLIDV